MTEFEQFINNIAGIQGWSDRTKGEIALDFLINAASSEIQASFAYYLGQIQATENDDNA